MTAQTALTTKPRTLLWAALFLLAMAGSAVIDIFELLPGPWPKLLMLASLFLIIPMMRSNAKQQSRSGILSPALRLYNRRIQVAGGIYVVCFLGATFLFKSLPAGSLIMWPIAAAAILPVLGMIWAMTRYVQDEEDEYLRFRAVRSAMIGLGVVLALGTTWGFLEMFELVPHVWSWWVFPVWAASMGLSHCWPRAKGEEA